MMNKKIVIGTFMVMLLIITGAAPEYMQIPSRTNLSPLTIIDGPAVVQDGRSVSGIFVVENPNQGYGIEHSRYLVAFYNDAGEVLTTDSGSIYLVLPGEKLPIVEKTYVEEGMIASDIEVQIMSGQTFETEVQPPMFPVESLSYFHDDYFPRTTGVIVNEFERSFSDLKVTAIGYDDEGNIVGGGYTYLDFIPADDQTGIDFSYNGSARPDSLFMGASVTSLSEWSDDNSGNHSISLSNYGWSQEDRTVAVGYLLKSNESSQMVEGTQYQVTVYDENGYVLRTDSGYLSYIFPGNIMGASCSLRLPIDTTASEVRVQIDPGTPTDNLLSANPLIPSNITYIPGSYRSKATGILKNSYEEQITDVKVTAIGYDEKGSIIGGGYTYVDFIKGNNQTAFEISLDFDRKPAKLEVYPGIGILTSIGEE
jgi:hypothetical protein